MGSFLRFFYSVLFYVLIPFVLIRLLWRSRAFPDYRKRWNERFAFYPFTPHPGGIWIHAVSVGEVNAAYPVIDALLKRYPLHTILITCTTPTGSYRITQLFGEVERVHHYYLPYDIPDNVHRFIRHFQPVLAIFLETEIWPNFYYYCHQYAIPLVIINGRLSEKSTKRYRFVRKWVQECLSSVSWVAAQTSTDAQRYLSLGMPGEKISVTGNVKFDVAFSPYEYDHIASLRSRGFQERPIFVAGSTHPGEEEQIVSAIQRIRSVLPKTLLVLAPRHVERNDSLETFCKEKGYSVQRRSDGLPCHETTNVYLLDTVGELKLFYGIADIAFVGGSLVPRGGHNVLEPAVVGIPVLYGPFMFHFTEIARMLIEEGGGIEIHNAEELAQQAIFLFTMNEKRLEIGNKAKACVKANQGATMRIIEHLSNYLLT